MKRRIILNLAMSIDGFIADKNGGFDWIIGDGNDVLNTSNVWDYDKFLQGIDTVVMGKRCYEQNFHNDFKDKKVFVATSDKIDDYDNIKFINGDITKIILKEQEKEGKDIFLFGGGVLLDSFIKENIINEYIIGIIPVILGKGRPLFLENNPKIMLKLEGYYIDNGIGVFRYSVR